ncbi:putative glutathione S-transferase kappa 1 [Mycena latifolia]|nr:putative glutathione S-transferase kappa 1 [Mycena latifolia]
MTGKIDCYLDCASFYSFLGFVYLLKQREVLATHDVSIEFHPIFLGGVNVSSGNKPPWTVPAKAAFGNAFESVRAKNYLGVPDIEIPPHIPLMTLNTQRSLCYIKATFPQSTFEQAWLALFKAMWIPPYANPALPDAVPGVLRDTKLFSDKEVDEIVAAASQKQWKDCLLENTKKVVDQGAFGAPWMWVRNGQGKEEPFFGSDRFHHIWVYLGLPWKDIELLPKATANL